MNWRALHFRSDVWESSEASIIILTHIIRIAGIADELQIDSLQEPWKGGIDAGLPPKVGSLSDINRLISSSHAESPHNCRYRSSASSFKVNRTRCTSRLANWGLCQSETRSCDAFSPQRLRRVSRLLGRQRNPFRCEFGSRGSAAFKLETRWWLFPGRVVFNSFNFTFKWPQVKKNVRRRRYVILENTNMASARLELLQSSIQALIL